MTRQLELFNRQIPLNLQMVYLICSMVTMCILFGFASSPPPPPVEVEKLVEGPTVVVDAMDTAFLSTVRLQNGTSCGTGFSYTNLGTEQLILTNAHVVGPVHSTTDVHHWTMMGKHTVVKGRVILRHLDTRGSPDVAVVQLLSRIPELKAIPLATQPPHEGRVSLTCGSPRCEMPSMHWIRWERPLGSQIYEWTPVSISGRSGSGVFEVQHGELVAVALLTWRQGGKGAGQSIAEVVQSVVRGQVSDKEWQPIPPGYQRH